MRPSSGGQSTTGRTRIRRRSTSWSARSTTAQSTRTWPRNLGFVPSAPVLTPSTRPLPHRPPTRPLPPVRWYYLHNHSSCRTEGCEASQYMIKQNGYCASCSRLRCGYNRIALSSGSIALPRPPPISHLSVYATTSSPLPWVNRWVSDLNHSPPHHHHHALPVLG